MEGLIYIFLINRDKNEAVEISEKTFSELNFKERNHLQEWIDKNPNILGEELLIIQKEFSGFSDTSERLDLLALDKQGNLVLIENKLDDSGKDVVWQALKYASYCESVSKSEIKEMYQKYLSQKGIDIKADENIADFLEQENFEDVILNSGDQRIILVAAKFRKEVTSTVMWLMRHGVDMKCICVTPYLHENMIFLDTEQILPVPNTEEFQIRINLKRQEESKTNEEKASRFKVRERFWTTALPILREKTGQYMNISPTKDNWINGVSGYNGIAYNCVILQKGVRAEFYIDIGEKEENKKIFDFFYDQREEIESNFSKALNWERLNEKRGCRISIYTDEDKVGLYKEDTWNEGIDFLANNINIFRNVFDRLLPTIINKLKNNS